MLDIITPMTDLNTPIVDNNDAEVENMDLNDTEDADDDDKFISNPVIDLAPEVTFLAIGCINCSECSLKGSR